MSLFLILFFVSVLIIIKKKKKQILCNDLFYLISSWILIIGIYMVSGVQFGKYGFSIQLIVFLFLCSLFFYLGRKKGYNGPVRVFGKNEERKPPVRLAIIGVLGIFMFLFDAFRLNNALFVLVASEKNEIELSIIGTIGSLLIPILLVVGIYMIANSWIKEGRLNILGLLMIFLYSIPCLLHSGRESLVYIVICIIVIYGYKSVVLKQAKMPARKKMLVFLVGVLALYLLGVGLYNISESRFGDNEISMFLAKHDVDAKTQAEAETWGNFSFLYYNILSYYDHQIAFLDFTLQNYHGPYLFGMYELNIISRRLPEWMGLDYNMAYDELERLFSRYNINFKGGWNTVLGCFIMDFSAFGAIIVCYFCGLFSGKIRKKFLRTLDIRYAILVALCCMCCFTTIMLGPFYNTMIYGTLIWWFIFYHGKETLKIQ